MPNLKYQRSAARERAAVNEARKRGCISARSAGSKSPIDVWVFDEAGALVQMIQIKTKKGRRKFKKRILREIKNVTVRLEWWSQ